MPPATRRRVPAGGGKFGSCPWVNRLLAVTPWTESDMPHVYLLYRLYTHTGTPPRMRYGKVGVTGKEVCEGQRRAASSRCSPPLSPVIRWHGVSRLLVPLGAPVAISHDAELPDAVVNKAWLLHAGSGRGASCRANCRATMGHLAGRRATCGFEFAHSVPSLLSSADDLGSDEQ